MKKLLLLVVVLPLMAQAQNFEGIITWKITSEITDPKVKAQMEEAKKKMDDPAMKAQMKEMETKMNDPQFKAMMDANPQMKAQLEASLKMMQSGDMSNLIPKSHVLKIKGQNYLSKMEGGPFADSELLYLNDKNVTYRIHPKDRTYSLIKPYTVAADDKTEVKVTKTSETAKVMGYTCVKYIAEISSQGHTVVQNIWTTPEIKGIDLKKITQQRMTNNQDVLVYDKIDGFPLKVEMKMPQGNMVMEVSDLKKQSLPASDFAIPAGFKEVQKEF